MASGDRLHDRVVLWTRARLIGRDQQADRRDALATNADSWDGYRTSRNHVFDMISALNIESFAVLTGDVHSAWVFDLPRNPFEGYDAATGKGSVGIEFAAPR